VRRAEGKMKHLCPHLAETRKTTLIKNGEQGQHTSYIITSKKVILEELKTNVPILEGEGQKKKG
jgi:hypothetical protein